MNHGARTGVDFDPNGISRYVQLATLFRRRIDSGEWPVGRQIPTVDALAAECGVARTTVRLALDILARENLIERFRAKGTFVRSSPREELWCAVGTDWSGLLRPTYNASIEVLSDTPDVTLSEVPYQTGVLAPAYRHLRRRHWRHEKPFLLASLHIDERLRDRITQEDIESKTALRLVHDLPGLEIVDATQTLTIGTADMATAASLSMRVNAPVAFVHRRVVDREGVLVLVAEGIYRGDVVRFDVKLR